MILSLGAMIDKLHAMREVRREKEKEIEELKSEYAVLEDQILAALRAQGLSKSTGGKATVSISENIKPQIENWDEFYKYIHRHKAYHLLERRPSVTGCREVFELRGRLPGAVPYPVITLNMRTINEK